MDAADIAKILLVAIIVVPWAIVLFIAVIRGYNIAIWRHHKKRPPPEDEE